MATIFYENSFVIAYQRITFRNEQDNNSDDASYQTVLRLKFKDFQGPKWTKENFKGLKGLEKGLLKFKGFQDAYEPWVYVRRIGRMTRNAFKRGE